MVECEKSGRVFYSKQNGRVSELIFQNSERELRDETSSIAKVAKIAKSWISSDRKRLYHIDH